MPTEEGWKEGELEAAFAAQQFERVTTSAIERYGGEVLGFLSARLKSPSDASEVFSMFCEDLWRGLPAFRWQCSLRGYCYTLARNAANRFSVSPPNRADRHSPLSQQPLSDLVERARSQTAKYLRTEAKSRMRLLREQLPEDEQTLLILRVDRDLSWDELAIIMGECTSDTPSDEQRRASARLRKRFQVAKEKLRELAVADGLIDE